MRHASQELPVQELPVMDQSEACTCGCTGRNAAVEARDAGEPGAEVPCDCGCLAEGCTCGCA